MEVDNMSAAMQWLCTALSRTQPTERSCQVRLALADWLHRRLRRGKLSELPDRFSGSHDSTLLLHNYCAHVALLRSTLLQQLSRFDAETAAQPADNVMLLSAVSQRQ